MSRFPLFSEMRTRGAAPLYAEKEKEDTTKLRRVGMFSRIFVFAV